MERCDGTLQRKIDVSKDTKTNFVEFEMGRFLVDTLDYIHLVVVHRDLNHHSAVNFGTIRCVTGMMIVKIWLVNNLHWCVEKTAEHCQ
jgi:hypothetical protein